MVKLLILADDFTGALDTGVQFAGKGIRTRVVVSREFKVEDSDSEVMVMDLETRHIPKEKAYEIVYNVCKKAAEAEIHFFYKKTDSALRGNVGSELQAIVDVFPSKEAVFVPAFPKMHRITVNGVHYIDGVPVKESVFGQDPFEPVRFNKVDELLHETGYRKEIINVGNESEKTKAVNSPTLYVCDAQTDEDLSEIASNIKISMQEQKREIPILAGCAGFATELPTLLNLSIEDRKRFQLKQNLIFLCGSVNPITRSQLAYGEKLGVTRICLKPQEKLEIDYWDQPEGKVQLNS